jgi:hypothetical protein
LVIVSAFFLNLVRYSQLVKLILNIFSFPPSSSSYLIRQLFSCLINEKKCAVIPAVKREKKRKYQLTDEEEKLKRRGKEEKNNKQ